MVHFTRACKTLLSENNKTRLTFEKQQEKNKNIICRPWSVRIEKNCALGLEHGPRPAASGRTQDLWHSFSQYGPPGRQIIYIYLKNIEKLKSIFKQYPFNNLSITLKSKTIILNFTNRIFVPMQQNFRADKNLDDCQKLNILATLYW